LQSRYNGGARRAVLQFALRVREAVALPGSLRVCGVSMVACGAHTPSEWCSESAARVGQKLFGFLPQIPLDAEISCDRLRFVNRSEKEERNGDTNYREHL